MNTLPIVLVGVPVAIILGGTSLAPIVNWSLSAILLLQIIKKPSPTAQ